jgi:hypothetical protein
MFGPSYNETTLCSNLLTISRNYNGDFQTIFKIVEIDHQIYFGKSINLKVTSLNLKIFKLQFPTDAALLHLLCM